MITIALWKLILCLFAAFVSGGVIGLFIMGMLAAERRQEEIGQLKKIIQEEA